MTKSKPTVRKETRENPNPKVTPTVWDPKKILRKKKIFHKASSSSKGKSTSEELFSIEEKVDPMLEKEEKVIKIISLGEFIFEKKRG